MNVEMEAQFHVFLTWAQLRSPAALNPYAFAKRLVGHQSLSGRSGEKPALLDIVGN
jgi:hypothetical protein